MKKYIMSENEKYDENLIYKLFNTKGQKKLGKNLILNIVEINKKIHIYKYKAIDSLVFNSYYEAVHSLGRIYNIKIIDFKKPLKKTIKISNIKNRKSKKKKFNILEIINKINNILQSAIISNIPNNFIKKDIEHIMKDYLIDNSMKEEFEKEIEELFSHEDIKIHKELVPIKTYLLDFFY